MDIQTGDTPQAGPLSIDDVLNGLEERPAPTEDQEEQSADTEVEETEEEVEVAETEEETDDAESEAEEEGPEVYALDEYGEIAIALPDGTQTTLTDLHKGTLRQADYTRKTTELSQERKALEERESALADRERQLNEQLASLDEQEPDWLAMAEEDPLGWQTQKLQWDQKQAERSKKKAEAEAAEQKRLESFRKQSAAIAVEKMPEWVDGAKFQATAEARKQAALAAGFTEQEFAGAVDFRLAVLLEKAARYDAGQTKVKVAQKKIAKAPKVVKPGTSVSKADKEQAARAAKRKQRSGPMTMDQMLNTIDYT